MPWPWPLTDFEVKFVAVRETIRRIWFFIKILTAYTPKEFSSSWGIADICTFALWTYNERSSQSDFQYVCRYTAETVGYDTEVVKFSHLYPREGGGLTREWVIRIPSVS